MAMLSVDLVEEVLGVADGYTAEMKERIARLAADHGVPLDEDSAQREVVALRRLVWCLIMAAGGTIEIPQDVMNGFDPVASKISSTESFDHTKRIYRAFR